jgi:hypothetical protein
VRGQISRTGEPHGGSPAGVDCSTRRSPG